MISRNSQVKHAIETEYMFCTNLLNRFKPDDCYIGVCNAC